MTNRPANTGQFEHPRMTAEESRAIRNYYFGECGDGRGFYPAQHKWLKVGCCKWCGLVNEAMQPRAKP